MTEHEAIVSSLEQEAASFEGLVVDATETQWQAPTPAPGWTVKDQVAHVAFVFNIAAKAAREPAAFKEMVDNIGPGGFTEAVEQGVQLFGAGTGAEVLQRWRDEVDSVSSAMRSVDPTTTVPWLVNPLPPTVLTMAGMLELFAHGQDIADTVGVDMPRTDRLAFLVHFIHRTRDFGYLAHEMEPPTEEFRFEVTLPSGAPMSVGPDDATNTVTGPALDLCLLATRRRHPDDLALTAQGAHATQWLPIAQAYRGPAGPGRRAGQFSQASVA